MRRQYDDFTQLKVKDMSKAISDMTYKYINPETDTPTKVPANHYEKILDQVTEKYMADITSKQFLTIMYNQLVALKKEDEKYFTEALICMDRGLNPKDLRIDEQIALEETNSYLEEIKKEDKRNFHFLDNDYINYFDECKSNPEIQSCIIKESNQYEESLDNNDDYEI